MKCYLWSIAFYGAENWDTSESRSEIPGTFGRRRVEKISCTDHVRIEEVLHRVKEERNFLRTITRNKAN